MIRSRAFIGCVIGLSSAAAFGQWSSDPGANSVVADRSGEQVQPKIKPTADGGAYVAWYDNGVTNYKGDTWTWNGTAWTRAASSGPAARVHHKLAYDSARQVTVLFGGSNAGGALSDGWEWNGTLWSPIAASGPSARDHHAMAYDSVRGEVVMFGGTDSTSTLLDETWTFNGTTWTQKSPVHAPSARKDHAMAWDSLRNVVVLFGGEDSSGKQADTWEWNGTDWSPISTVGTPGPRSLSAMAFDPVNSRVHLFAGADAGGTALQDTWTYDGTTWAQAAPATNPNARFGHAMANDNTVSGQRLVVFGGNSGTFNVGSMFEWSGTNWASKTTTPTNRAYPAMAYDAARQQTVLFGGIDLGGYDVYLQRLDCAGVEQWAHNGVKIADRGVSSTQDYDLVVDGNGNAVLAYNDDQVGTTTTQQISVSKVTPAGTILWKTSIAGTTPPHMAALSDGSYAVAFSDGPSASSVVRMQKFNSAGAIQWGPTGIAYADIGTTVRPMFVSDVQTADNGAFIVLWVRQFNGTISSSRWLLTQKFDGNGAPLWTPTANVAAALGPVNGVVIYQPDPGSSYSFVNASGGIGTGTYSATQGGSLTTAYFPTFISDGAGGGVYGWYENAGPRNAYMQHVTGNGTLKFAQNGVSNAFTMLNPGRIRIGAAVAYDAASGDYFLSSIESGNPTQGNYSCIVQRYDSSGIRQWTDAAVTLPQVPQGTSNQGSFVQCQSAGPNSHGCLVFGFDSRSATTGIVFGARVDDDDSSPTGATVAWSNQPCSIVDNKSRLASTMSTRGYAMLAFGNMPSGSTNIHVQNVNLDGTFGAKPCILTDPSSRTACLGASTTFSVAAEGTGVLSYQWRRGGVDIGGATSASLTIPAVTAADAGSYTCAVTNALGTTISAAATLSVCIGDFNCTGTVTVQDIFDFLAAYFSNDPRADVNASGAVSVQDIFDFLAAYFAGCA